MEKTIEKNIALSNLQLDLENSRHEVLSSQVDIIEWMTEGGKNIGEKVYRLAKDIVENGLNPSEKISVIINSKDPSKYIVMEGNRRITALKLLQNPGSAPTAAWKKRFSSLTQEKNYQPTTSVPCVIYKSLENALHFMEIKHMGESDGVGTVPWNAFQKARHDRRRNRKHRYHKAVSLLGHIEHNPHIYGNLSSAIDQNFNITTLDRVLSDIEFRDFLGLSVSTEGELSFLISSPEASKPIKKLVKDLQNKSISVNDVKNKSLRENYKNTFTQKDLPKNRNQGNSEIPVDNNSVKPVPPKLKENKKSGAGAPNHQDPDNRIHIVQRGDHISIDPKTFNRPHKIFNELKRLKLNININSVASLMRCFIEMSTVAFIDVKKLSSKDSVNGWTNIKLAHKIRAVNNFFLESQWQSKNQARVIEKIITNTKMSAHPSTLNDLVHNYHQVVNRKELIEIWDTYRVFLALIWDKIN